MYKLGVRTGGYSWPVIVHVPEDGGRTSRHTFDAHFKRFTRTQADALTEKIGKPRESDGEPYTVLDVVCEIMDDWGKQVVDNDDQPVPFSETALRSMCDETPQATGAVFNAWTESLAKGRQKN